MLVWWATRPELHSALARAVRERRIKPAQLDSILARADAIWSKASVVDPENAILEQTQRLLFAYPLRASDALQLAAAVAITDGQPQELDFISFDQRLQAAARAEASRFSRLELSAARNFTPAPDATQVRGSMSRTVGAMDENV
jgi:hypothetical protein